MQYRRLHRLVLHTAYPTISNIRQVIQGSGLQSSCRIIGILYCVTHRSFFGVQHQEMQPPHCRHQVLERGSHFCRIRALACVLDIAASIVFEPGSAARRRSVVPVHVYFTGVACATMKTCEHDNKARGMTVRHGVQTLRTTASRSAHSIVWRRLAQQPWLHARCIHHRPTPDASQHSSTVRCTDDGSRGGRCWRCGCSSRTTPTSRALAGHSTLE
jgi:hypothetical protein